MYRGNSESFVPSPGDPDKPAQACLAVDEATPLAMGAADRRQCERTMRGWYAETWYAETWYPRPERDALIAAAAIGHGMTVVTGNPADFEATGVALIDPWAEA